MRRVLRDDPSDPEVRDLLAGPRHLRLHPRRQHREGSLSSGAGSALLRQCLPRLFRWTERGGAEEGGANAGAHPLRDRPGPLLQNDARRGSSVGLAETGSAAELVHSRSAGRADEDERLRREHLHLPHRQTKRHQEQGLLCQLFSVN